MRMQMQAFAAVEVPMAQAEVSEPPEKRYKYDWDLNDLPKSDSDGD